MAFPAPVAPPVTSAVAGVELINPEAVSGVAALPVAEAVSVSAGLAALCDVVESDV